MNVQCVCRFGVVNSSVRLWACVLQHPLEGHLHCIRWQMIECLQYFEPLEMDDCNPVLGHRVQTNRFQELDSSCRHPYKGVQSYTSLDALQTMGVDHGYGFQPSLSRLVFLDCVLPLSMCVRCLVFQSVLLECYLIEASSHGIQ